MENATKALIIAGAVLITIMVLAMATYFYSQYKEFPKVQEKAKEQEQIAKFNAEYESYNKQKMYGVDVVTIVNKCINNNKRYANFISGKYLLGDNNYYIDVQIKLIKPVSSYATEYKVDDYGFTDQILHENKTIRGKINGKAATQEYVLGPVFANEKNISLLDFKDTEVFMDKTFEEFFSDYETVKIQLEGTSKFDEFNYTLVNSGFTDFKRKYFQCTSIEYNTETSRVSKIVFTELPKGGEG